MSPLPSSVDFSPSIHSQTPFAAVGVTLFAATLAIAPVAQAQLPAGPPTYGCYAPNTGSVYATSYGGATMPTAPTNAGSARRSSARKGMPIRGIAANSAMSTSVGVRGSIVMKSATINTSAAAIFASG